MIKRFCDACKKEIKAVSKALSNKPLYYKFSIFPNVGIKSLNDDNYEICVDCRNEVMRVFSQQKQDSVK